MFDLEVLSPEDMVGEVMGDAQTRRAMIAGMDSEDTIKRSMPRFRYQNCLAFSTLVLRSITQEWG
ncbi:MAG: hypothetical protein IPP89_19690 [Saprospiraceae bacterium]|nr:hypothetical protein [Candidatus Brachybacter algidus]MBL0121116.1 hypothetical protein [Candidatus Brachybacter algidus]